MFDAIIAFSLRQRTLILLLTLALVAGGIYAFTLLPIDAVPDVTNNQVQVLTKAPTLSALEVERYVSFPIEIALKSLPHVEELRSISQPGLSVVTVVFEEGEDIYFARQQMLEKLREAEEDIPEGVERPELSPVATGLGEVFRYVIRDTTGKLSPMDLRTVQDWIVRRGLLGTPGLAEVNSLGGFVKQYHVLVDPGQLVSYGLTLRDVFDAVARSSNNSGGGYIETGPEKLSVRAVGLATSIEDLKNTTIRSTASGTPVLLGNVATVEVGPALRFGSASQDGKGEVVSGITMQLKGANSRITVNAVKERLDEIRPALPEGVVIEPYYDREVLVDQTITTVLTNLIEGALLVIGVLLLFLVNLRAGIIVASVVPLAMMFAGIMMVLTGQTGNLMSLGAIDFGLVVDGSLIIVENCLRVLDKRLREHPGAAITDAEMRNLIYGGSVEVRKAAQFGEIIIAVVYLPILTLQGIEGKLFRPMALVVIYALAGALILSITYVPVMLSFFMKRTGQIKHSPVITFLERHYTPALQRALRWRAPILAGTVILLAGSVLAFTRMGGEFLPRLDEGDILLQLIRLPSVSLTESQKIATHVEKVLMRFPEVRTVVSNTGRAEISTDPMGVEVADMFVMLHPRDEWSDDKTKEELIEEMEKALSDVPGAGYQFLQPIEMRTNELIAGARGDVVVKVTGDDYAVMGPIAEKVATALRQTEGGEDVTLEQTSGLPQLLIQPDRAAISRYGLNVGDVNEIVATAIAGTKAAEVAEGERRFDVVVRFPEYARNSVDAVRTLLVTTPEGQRIPLSELATVSVQNGPNQISREEGSRFVSVQANVRGRDVQSFVEDVRARVARDIELPAGYNITYGGQFENLQAASDRLMIVVPISLALIFLLLFQTFRSVRLGIMIFLCVPMAVIGGVAALLIGGMPFSISAGVGFIALFGIAVLNGIVMVAAIRKFQAHGEERRDAVLHGAVERLRPVVTTAALAGFGFLPMMLAQGAGAEVQRPLATVIIGGLVSSTFLTLFVLPIVYDWFGGKYIEGREETPSEIAVEEREPTRQQLDPIGGAVVIAIVFLLTAANARAQTPVTREFVRERAIATSAEMRRAQGLISLRRAEAETVGIPAAPELLLSVDESPSVSLTGRGNTSIGISQELALPMVYSAEARLLATYIRQAEAEQLIVSREIAFRSATAYTELVAAATLLDLADSAVALTGRFARLADRRRELGEANALEAVQATLALSNARQRRAEALANLQRAAATVRALMLAPSNEPVTTDERLSLRPIALSAADLERRFWQNHPQLEAARIAVEAARAQEAVVSNQRLPSFEVQYARQTVDGEAGFYGGELRVAVPIWRILSDSPDRAAQAETALREAELTRDSVSLAASVRTLYATHEAARASIAEFTDRLIPQATDGVRISLRLFEEGEASYLEVLAAQEALLETQRAYNVSLAEVERLRTELEYIVGEAL